MSPKTKPDRVHTVYVYLIGGKPKVSSDYLYVKPGDRVKWVSESDEENREFQIIFPDSVAMGFRQDNTPTQPHVAGGPKGVYKYNVRHLASDAVLDPSVDIGDPGGP